MTLFDWILRWQSIEHLVRLHFGSGIWAVFHRLISVQLSFIFDILRARFIARGRWFWASSRLRAVAHITANFFLVEFHQLCDDLVTLDGLVHPFFKINLHLFFNSLMQFFQCFPLEQLIIEKLSRRAPNHRSCFSLTCFFNLCFFLILPDCPQMVCIEIYLECLVLIFHETLLAKSSYLFYFFDDLSDSFLRVLHLIEPLLCWCCCQRSLQSKVDFSELLHWQIILQVSVCLIYPRQDARNLTSSVLQLLYSGLCNS